MRILFAQSSVEILKDYIEALEKGYGEISRIARLLNVSTSLVSQVMAGVKTLTPEQAQRLSVYLGMTDNETDCFTFLVQMERAGTPELRQYWSQKLSVVRSRSKSLVNRVVADGNLSETERAIFYSSALYSAVRVYTSTSGNGRSVEEICARFQQSRTRIGAVLEFLVESGLCRVENDYYFVGPQKTHLESSSPFLLKHHANWRMRALHRGDDLTSEELMYTAPVSLSRDDFHKLREEMVHFIQEFLKTVHASPAEEIACFNLDFFWIR